VQRQNVHETLNKNTVKTLSYMLIYKTIFQCNAAACADMILMYGTNYHETVYFCQYGSQNAIVNRSY